MRGSIKVEFKAIIWFLLTFFIFLTAINTFVTDVKKGNTLFHSQPKTEDKAVDAIEVKSLIIDKRVAVIDEKLKSENDKTRQDNLKAEKTALESKKDNLKAVKNALKPAN